MATLIDPIRATAICLLGTNTISYKLNIERQDKSNNNDSKELNCCDKLKFSNPNTFET